MIYTTITSDPNEIGQPGKSILVFEGKLKLFQVIDLGAPIVSIEENYQMKNPSIEYVDLKRTDPVR